jgi:hypothetical protein
VHPLLKRLCDVSVAGAHDSSVALSIQSYFEILDGRTSPDSESPRRALARDPRAVLDYPGFPEFQSWFAIHDADLPLFGAAVTTAVGLFGDLKPAALAGGLITLLYGCYRKHAHLTPDQGWVLYVLRRYVPQQGVARHGLSLDEIVLRSPESLGLDVARVQATLEGLRRIVLANGTSTSFVESADGRWWSVDV